MIYSQARRVPYTMHGVLHYVQHEWSRYEMERAQWEMERAELQVSFFFVGQHFRLRLRCCATLDAEIFFVLSIKFHKPHEFSTTLNEKALEMMCRRAWSRGTPWREGECMPCKHTQTL